MNQPGTANTVGGSTATLGCSTHSAIKTRGTVLQELHELLAISKLLSDELDGINNSDIVATYNNIAANIRKLAEQLK